jgi:hypothetical protein
LEERFIMELGSGREQQKKLRNSLLASGAAKLHLPRPLRIATGTVGKKKMRKPGTWLHWKSSFI